MNNLSWLIYLAEVCEGLKGASIGLTIFGGIGATYDTKGMLLLVMYL